MNAMFWPPSKPAQRREGGGSFRCAAGEPPGGCLAGSAQWRVGHGVAAGANGDAGACQMTPPSLLSLVLPETTTSSWLAHPAVDPRSAASSGSGRIHRRRPRQHSTGHRSSGPSPFSPPWIASVALSGASIPGCRAVWCINHSLLHQHQHQQDDEEEGPRCPNVSASLIAWHTKHHIQLPSLRCQ